MPYKDSIAKIANDRARYQRNGVQMRAAAQRHDRPIIFRAPMVKALLDGRKSQTRRLAALPPKKIGGRLMTGCVSPWTRVQPGDRLWVKEAWQYARKQYCACPQPSEPSPCDDWHEGIGCRSDREGIVLRADGDQAPIWRPSIHMPRWASRLTLIVTATKIERLHSMSTADECAEGFDIATMDFCKLWDALHGPGAYDANPEVVALTFRVVRANIDSAEARAA